MDKYKEQKDETLRFLTLLEKTTKAKIDLFYMKVEPINQQGKAKKYGRKLIVENIRPREAYYTLKRENAWWENDTRFENVYWTWSRQETEVNIAFIDDIQNIDKFTQLNHFCLLQTSEKKFQALFRLNKPVTIDQLHDVQAVIRQVYGGDKSALASLQLKRVPGFFNTKYVSKPMTRVSHIGTNVIETDKILDYIKKTKERESRFEILKPTIETRPKTQTQVREKTWEDFYTGDASRADLSYVHYLLSKGCDEDEITRKLYEESPDLKSRKYNPDDYIRRTIQKAKSYHRPLR